MVNIAVIGFGRIGRIHAENVLAHPSATLSFVCDSDPLRLADAAELGAKTTASVEEALASDVDGVIVAATTAAHAQLARAAVTAKVPFLIEKPLALDVAEAAAIANDAHDADVLAATAFNRRHHDAYVAIRNAVRNGQLGRLETLSFVSRTDRPPTLDFVQASGGLFAEKGSHFYDLACWITGQEPVEVQAMGAALVVDGFAEAGETDTALISLRMSGGTLCHFDFSWRAAYGQDERVEAHGALGMMQTPQAPVSPVVHHDVNGRHRGGVMPTWAERFASTYVTELDHFIRALQGAEVQQLPSLRDGVRAQRIADAARKAAAEGIRIVL